MKRTSDIEAWRLLAACLKTGELSRAAQAEGVELSAASRLFSSLEQELGVALFDRQTRPAKLTQAAERLAPAAKRLMRAHRELLAEAKTIRKETIDAQSERTVRVSLPANLDRQVVMLAVMRLAAKTPGIKVEFSADSGIAALLAGKTDISLASYRIDEPALFRLHIDSGYTFLMASRRYEARYGLPREIGELAAHRLINRFSANLSYSDVLERGAERCFLGPTQRIIQGDAAACREMLLAGEGIAIDINVGYVARELAAGELVPVLKGWHRPPWDYNVYCRVADEKDDVTRRVMASIASSVFSSTQDQWRFWYQKLGIPDPATAR